MLKTFARFDKDGSGFIEANEMGSLKKFFSVDEVDVNVKDGRIDQIELLAALNKCSISEAQAAFDRFHYKRSRQSITEAKADVSKISCLEVPATLGAEKVEDMLRIFARLDREGRIRRDVQFAGQPVAVRREPQRGRIERSAGRRGIDP